MDIIIFSTVKIYICMIHYLPISMDTSEHMFIIILLYF